MKSFTYPKMKIVHHSNIHGKTLSKIYLCSDGWKSLKTATQVPDMAKLFNFDVQADRTFLVLDNYGDEVLPDRIMKKLLGFGLFQWNLVIDRADGMLYSAIFYLEGTKYEGTKYVIALTKLEHGEGPMRLPKKYLGRLDELKNKKRPYFLTCQESSVWAFVDRWAGYATLQQNLIVDLYFDRRRVQVWGDTYREVTDWA